MKINRLKLLKQIFIGISFIFFILYIIYYFTYIKEDFENNQDTLSITKKKLFFKQFLDIRNILFNDFNIYDKKLIYINILGQEYNITTGDKKKFNINDINEFVLNNITKKELILLADIIGYYEMNSDFMKELNDLPYNERLNWYKERKHKVDKNNNMNVHSWGYIGSLIEKYLETYPFFGNKIYEKFSNSSIKPIMKINKEPIKQHIDVLLMTKLPDPNNTIIGFDEHINRGYELSLVNTKQVLKLLKCLLITKLNDPFNDTIDCNEEKINEYGVSIVGYNVFSLSINK